MEAWDADTRRMMQAIESNWDARTPIHVASEFYGADEGDTLTVRHDYLPGRGPVEVNSPRTYTDGPPLDDGSAVSYEWPHGLGELVNAVTGSVNQSKSDRDPVDWLPDNHVCKYARHWVAIKYRWKLSINAAEKRKLTGILTAKWLADA